MTTTHTRRQPARFVDPDEAAAAVLTRLNGRVRLALPLGLGKAVLLANALYRRARADAGIDLQIYTALSLEPPAPRSELEARFLEPLLARLYARVPVLEYARDRQHGSLPANVRVHEFYFRPGALLGNAIAQRDYVSSNYSSAAQDIAAAKINVIGQMVAPRSPTAEIGSDTYSLSCNPDLTDDLLAAMAAQDQPRPLLVGEANPALPFFGGSAAHPATEFDLLIEGPSTRYDLFPVPNQPVSLTEHAIGVRLATQIPDGGTLQIGIGGVADALCSALINRRRDNAGFRRMADSLATGGDGAHLDDLPSGLYGMSEMFVEGFLHLYQHGILKRRAADGCFLHAAFFLGSAQFYRALAALEPAVRAKIGMSRISFTNRLLQDTEAKIQDRRHARFVNSTMMVTLLGAAISDTLANGRVVSGVGGQHDFQVMARELPDGRAILALPATRTARGSLTSNIVWQQEGNATVPRHLRDLVVTEYGIADLRGASDETVIRRLLNIADSRFQDELRRQAVAAGKLDPSYRIPGNYQHNRPEKVHAALAAADAAALLPHYPLGTDFTELEATLVLALNTLKQHRSDWRRLLALGLRGRRMAADAAIAPLLARLELDRARSLRDRAYRWLVAAALAEATGKDGIQRPLWSGFPSQ